MAEVAKETTKNLDEEVAIKLEGDEGAKEEKEDAKGDASTDKEVKQEEAAAKAKEPEKKESDKNGDTKDDPEAVKERLRFFFSDANVRQDAFIRKYLMEGGEQETKGVPVDVLLRFNTIKQHTTSPKTILQAAKELDTILTVTDDNIIGRVDPFTESKMNENIPNTLYLSNLPVERNRHKNSTDEIRQLFGDKASTIVLVKFRFGFSDRPEDHDDDDLDLTKPQQGSGKKRGGRRVPLGACLVEFESLEALEAAAAHTLTSKDDGETVQPKKVLKLGEHHIVEVQLLKDYIESRKNVKKRKQSDLHVEEPASPAKVVIDWKPGCVIQVTGFGSKCDREAILDAVAKDLGMTVEKLKDEQNVFADFSRGQSTGAIRFHEPSVNIQKLCDKLNAGEVTIAGEKVEKAEILSGDEEKKYWDDYMEFKTKQKQQREEDRANRAKNSNRYNNQRKKGRRS